jgi:hypothetical protein
VTDARLSLVPIPGWETRYLLACFQNQERIPFALHGVGERLFVQQAIEVVGDHCQTVSYAYRFQSADDAWLMRWEYSRERPRLIAEWGVTPKTDGWYDVLDESLAGFEQRRTAP